MRIFCRYNLTAAQMGYSSTTLVARTLRGGLGALQTVDDKTPLALSTSSPDDPEVVVLSPVLDGGWTLLGEPNKWVSVSPQRFLDVQSSDKSASAVLNGADGEVVTVVFQDPHGQISSTQCKIGTAGTVTVKVTAGESTGACA